MKKTIIFGSCLAVFLMLMIPNVNAVESNTVLNLKKSFLNRSPILIKEQIKDNLLLKINATLLFVLLSVLLDAVGGWFIIRNHIVLGTLILFANLFMIINFV